MTKRKALVGGQETEGYLCNDGSGEILAVLTDTQPINGSVLATVTPHALTPGHKTHWRKSIVNGDSEQDIIERYVKAQSNTVRQCVTREDLEGHLLKNI